MQYRAQVILLPALALVAAVALSACGSSVNNLTGVGGGSGFAVLGTLTSGFFRDSNVSGLSYSTATHNGLTDASGSFTYEVGETVTFTVGNLVVGAATGAGMLSPLDLAGANVSTTSSPTTQNITRFLMLLDKDANPSNGIVISAAVQKLAAKWPTKIDFTGDLPTVLAGTTILSDLNSIPGETHVLPSASAAQAHLDATLLCTYSGAFGGTYGGGQTAFGGNIGVAIDPLTGFASGYALTTGESQLLPLTGDAPLLFDDVPLPTVLAHTNEASYSFQFSDLDDISGNWNEGAGTDQGSFSASRGGTDQTPEYRFTGTYLQNDNKDGGVLAFGIQPITDPDNVSLSGQGYSVATQVVTQISGNIVGVGSQSTLNAQTDSNLQFLATINLDATSPGYLSFSGTYTNSASPINPGSPIGTIQGDGCVEY